MCVTTATGNSDGLGVFSCRCGLVVSIYVGLRRTHARHAAEIHFVAERAAVADGSRFREVQRELRGSKPESRGTEIEKLTTWGVAPREKDEGEWKLFVEAFVLHSPVIEHGHHAGKWLSTGRVHWAPVPSKSSGCFFFELYRQTWECQDDGWKVWEAPDTTIWRLKRIGNWLAVHTRVHPRCIRSGVTVDGWCHSPHTVLALPFGLQIPIPITDYQGW
jgi:hypothetical protein